MIEIDFHGWLPAAAEDKIHSMIGEARHVGVPTHIKFITGNGKIKQIVIDIANTYGVHCQEQLGNRGALIALIE